MWSSPETQFDSFASHMTDVRSLARLDESGVVGKETRCGCGEVVYAHVILPSHCPFCFAALSLRNDSDTRTARSLTVRISEEFESLEGPRRVSIWSSPETQFDSFASHMTDVESLARMDESGDIADSITQPVELSDAADSPGIAQRNHRRFFGPRGWGVGGWLLTQTLRNPFSAVTKRIFAGK